MRLNVAIDGPVGAGKSTVADAVAARLGILHLDTGAMYRALGLKALREGMDVQDEEAMTGLCDRLELAVQVGENVDAQTPRGGDSDAQKNRREDQDDQPMIQ